MSFCISFETRVCIKTLSQYSMQVFDTDEENLRWYCAEMDASRRIVQTIEANMNIFRILCQIISVFANRYSR